MMAPTIVLRDGEVELALGSAGSNRLRSAILQVIRYVVDCGMDVAEAVRAAACTTRPASCTRSRASGRSRSTSSSAAATAWCAGGT